MTSQLDDLKGKVSGLREPEDEWRIIGEAIDGDREEREAILRWTLVDFKEGYVLTRARAGVALHRSHPEKVWELLGQLALSPFPDDRDAALTALATLGGPRAAELAKPMLDDPYPYLQLEAAEFLDRFYPAEVRACLEQLQGSDLQWIANQAKELLSTL